MLEGKNGVSGKIILDSISPDGIRLTTIHVRYPRMIHSELMTHRVFSRNGRSSRAVPVKTLLMETTYMPHFMKNKAGMVAVEELSLDDYEEAVAVWATVSEQIKTAVGKLSELGVHKQWANRLLEPIGYIDVLITSTDWANFMALRDEEGAQPEIRSVAELIKELMDNSEPKLLQPEEWHLPYITEEDYKAVSDFIIEKSAFAGDDWEPGLPVVLTLLRKISVARCARLTIKPFDGDGSILKELQRYSLLMESRPVHASPAEHIATPDEQHPVTTESTTGSTVTVYDWNNPHQHGNFYGWRQFRKMIPFNTIEDR